MNLLDNITTNETRVEVVEGGRGLEVEVVWLAPLQDATKMMNPDIEDGAHTNYTDLHP